MAYTCAEVRPRDWCLIGDDGGEDSGSVCGFIPHADGEAPPCEEDGVYSLLREGGTWYALCAPHTALVREQLGSNVLRVKDVRPVGVVDEEIRGVMADWVAEYRRWSR